MHILQIYHPAREIKLCPEPFETVGKGQLLWGEDSFFLPHSCRCDYR